MHEKNLSHIRNFLFRQTFCSRRGCAAVAHSRRTVKLFLCMLQRRYHNLNPSRPHFRLQTYNFLFRLKIQIISCACFRQMIFSLKNEQKPSSCFSVKGKVLYFILRKRKLLYSLWNINPQDHSPQNCYLLFSVCCVVGI